MFKINCEKGCQTPGQEEGFDDPLAGKLGKEKITRTRAIIECGNCFVRTCDCSKLLEGQFVFAW